MHGLRGGASFQRADAEGGQVFSAPEFRNSSAPPVPINNDRSLKPTNLTSPAEWFSAEPKARGPTNRTGILLRRKLANVALDLVVARYAFITSL